MNDEKFRKEIGPVPPSFGISRERCRMSLGLREVIDGIEEFPPDVARSLAACTAAMLAIIENAPEPTDDELAEWLATVRGNGS